VVVILHTAVVIGEWTVDVVEIGAQLEVEVEVGRVVVELTPLGTAGDFVVVEVVLVLDASDGMISSAIAIALRPRSIPRTRAAPANSPRVRCRRDRAPAMDVLLCTGPPPSSLLDGAPRDAATLTIVVHVCDPRRAGTDATEVVFAIRQATGTSTPDAFQEVA
jgi:hypothetical protein